MRRRAFLGALAAAAQPAPRPNVILAMADDQGWGDTGYKGHATLRTPALDDMAARGVRFDRFYSGAPVCSPTRGSCLTGRHPFRYGIFFANADNGEGPSKYALPAREITLAEVLRERGYSTGHFGKWHLGDFAGEKKSSPADNGFDHYFSTVRKTSTLDPTGYWRDGERVSPDPRGDDSTAMLDRALPFLKAAVGRRQPFFAVLWFHTPHLPVVGSAELRARFAGHAPQRQHYWAALTALDQQMGRLRRELRSMGAANDTMLWYCSDNGPEGDRLDEKSPGSAGPWRGRKRSLFEGGIRVPGLLEWPARFPKPKTISAACSTSDYLPTILSALGVPAPKRPLDGIDLMPVLDGRRRKRERPIPFETIGDTRGSPKMAWVEDRYKLLTNLEPSGDLLYDLDADPAETVNLADREPARVRSMRQALGEWRESCGRSRDGADG